MLVGSCWPLPVSTACTSEGFFRLQTPTEKEWLDVAGPHLCSGSYVYQLLDEEQKAGNVLRIQYFQDG